MIEKPIINPCLLTEIMPELPDIDEQIPEKTIDAKGFAHNPMTTLT